MWKRNLNNFKDLVKSKIVLNRSSALESNTSCEENIPLEGKSDTSHCIESSDDPKISSQQSLLNPECSFPMEKRTFML